MAAYRMTPARRAALRKAQLASAKKRRRGAAIGRSVRKSIKGARSRHRASMRVINSRRAKEGLKPTSAKRAAAKTGAKIAAEVSIHQTLKSIHPALGLAHSAAMAGRSYHKTRSKKKRRR